MIGRITNLSIGMAGELQITVAVHRDHAEEIERLQRDDVEIDIRKRRKKRSLSANALAWMLCHEICVAMQIPKEEVYRKAIREVGVFDDVDVRAEAVPTLMRNWSAHGVGWLAEDMGDSYNEGYRTVFLYTGSSAYDSKQMSRLIDYLVDDAKQIGITLRATPEQIEEAKRLWGDKEEA